MAAFQKPAAINGLKTGVFLTSGMRRKNGYRIQKRETQVI